MSTRRVAVTGCGVISPLGNSVEEFHRSLAEGRSGVRLLPSELTQGSGVQVGATVEWGRPSWFTEAEASNIDRVSQFALDAAEQAIISSGINLEQSDRERIGVYWGTGMGGVHTIESSYRNLFTTGVWRTRPLTVVMAMSNAAGSNVALRHQLRGPFANFSTACSSSAVAIGEAMYAIAAGRADAILAGGSEALLVAGTLLAWQALRTLAPADADNPAASCKPFDARRRGLVLGEGAAALLLEDETHARARSARIHAYVTGYGNTCDASHMSRPHRAGQESAMREALSMAQLTASDIAYINAHGTATAVGDVVEAEAINAIFGGHAERVKVSSTKSMHGHLLGAAGAVELIATLLVLEEGVIPPTAFLREPDRACRLNHVAGEAQRMPTPRAVMSNSFAFGGSNAVLIAERA